MNGTIDIDTGNVWLIPIVSADFYPYKTELKTSVLKGKFYFSDSVLYPTAYKIFLKCGDSVIYVSGDFFIEHGHQYISCDIDSNNITPEIENKSTNELNGEFCPYFADIDKKVEHFLHTKDSLKTKCTEKDFLSMSTKLSETKEMLSTERSHAFLMYSRQHPESYVVLWTLINNLVTKGYHDIDETIYDNMSKDVKESYSGRKLREKLRILKKIKIGNPFPQLKLYDQADNVVALSKFNRSKYTLVDFWFTHCPSCIKEFKKYKEIYSLYKRTDFEIIGVSIDDDKYISEWKKMIVEKELAWPQYLDKEQVNSKFLSLEYFPSNFLLDENGLIIKKNVSTVDLEKLLSENINK